MRKVLFPAAICAVLVVGSGLSRANNLLATQIQAAVMDALTELKFSFVPDPSGTVGGPAKLRITQETIQHLQRMMQEGKVIVVDSDGKITTEAGQGKGRGKGK